MRSYASHRSMMGYVDIRNFLKICTKMNKAEILVYSFMRSWRLYIVACFDYSGLEMGYEHRLRFVDWFFDMN
jgi:hypothetical protein